MVGEGTPISSYGQSLSGEVTLALPEFDAPPPGPISLACQWIAAAERRNVREPRALAVATANGAGRVSSRVVLMKRFDSAGVLFTSSYESRKGRELEENPQAAGTLYWRETLQQITFGGVVVRVGEDEADQLFNARPRAAQAVTAVSRQSQPLEDEAALHAAVRQLVDSGEPIPRPRTWGGYRLTPDIVEFWCGSPDRLHRRMQYERVAGRWKTARLQP